MLMRIRLVTTRREGDRPLHQVIAAHRRQRGPRRSIHACTVKSVTPHWENVIVSVGADGAPELSCTV